MAQIEARLVISGKDETGGAFKSLKEQIAGLGPANQYLR